MSARSRLEAFRRLLTQVRQRLGLSFGFVLWDGATVPDDLPADALVNDIVYAPLETALLAAARARGNMAVDGLGMLLHQAVPGFEAWFGVRPTVTAELRELIVKDLGGK